MSQMPAVLVDLGRREEGEGRRTNWLDDQTTAFKGRESPASLNRDGVKSQNRAQGRGDGLVGKVLS